LGWPARDRVLRAEDQPGESPLEALMIVFHGQAPGSAEFGTPIRIAGDT